MGRLLQGVQEEIYLQTITGGDKDNVITGKTSATILCTGDVSSVCDCLQQRKEQLCQEFVAAEPNLSIEIVSGEKKEMEVFSNAFTKQLMDYLNLSITGVQLLSALVP